MTDKFNIRYYLNFFKKRWGKKVYVLDKKKCILTSFYTCRNILNSTLVKWIERQDEHP